MDKKFNIKDKNEYIKLIKFALVGGMNTLIDWLVYFILTKFVAITPWIASTIAYCCGIASSYFGNKHFTFKAKNKTSVLEVVKFLVVNALSLGASTGVVALCTEVFLWNPYVAKVLSTGISMLINYLGSRFFVFVTDKK
ncbi:MAG: GtrA family protein [Clostridia bacterium]|nr:GtrA family protein [Clostridia bacterium]